MLTPRAKDDLRYAAAIATVGILAGTFAALFRGAMTLVCTRLFGEPDVLRAFQALPRAARWLVPTIGGAAAATLGVVAARRAAGHGVAEILEAVVLGRGRPAMATTLW